VRTADGHIIRKCLDGNSAAFGFLVDKYKESVYALAYSMLRNFHDAEDVTQEVFIKAYKKLHTLKQYDSFHAWLFAITSNFSRNLIRNRSKRPDRGFIEDQEPEVLEESSLDLYREELVYQSIKHSY
jgi:RNA polymerase sigma factor (sigma-70 family)